MDDAHRNKTQVRIVVTQPRRIAARSLADRVSRERGWELGTVVGYQVFFLSFSVSKKFERFIETILGWFGFRICIRRQSHLVLYDWRFVRKIDQNKIVGRIYAHNSGRSP